MVLGGKLLRSIPPVPMVLGILQLLCPTSACQSTDSKTDAGGVQGNIVITNQNNYKATSKLTIPRVQTAAGVDLDICWGGMKTDFLCHSINPATDIDSLSFLQVQNLTEAEVADDLGIGKSFANNVVPRLYHTDEAPGSTCTKLSAFADNPTAANPIMVNPARDYVAASNKVYMLLFQNGTKLGLGSRSMVFLEPGADATVTAVNAQADSCSILDFEADITTPSPIAVPAAGPFEVDWSNVTQDGLKNEVIYDEIDELQLGFYENTSVATLQKQFLDLDRIATSFYQLTLSGQKHANLTSAVSATGEAFAGFTKTDGVWAIALRCSTCQVPAPIAVAILNPS